MGFLNLTFPALRFVHVILCVRVCVCVFVYVSLCVFIFIVTTVTNIICFSSGGLNSLDKNNNFKRTLLSR